MSEPKTTMRDGTPWPADHPLADAEPTTEDCISDVPARVLEAVAAYHNHEEPQATPVPEGEELV